jgi:hypothetical protein
MIRKLPITLLILTYSLSAFATDPATCTRLTGSWYGNFALKSPRDCHIYHGCSHSMLAEVKHIDGIHYQAAVHPKIGREGIYDITCENGNVISTETTGTIQFTCIDRTICQVKYNDDKLSANLLSAGV